MNALGRYLMNWLRWLDEGLNVLTGGDANETMSSRAGKGMREGKRWACLLCRFLDLFQRDHCIRSINPDDGANATIPD
ncbi:MULTISPECIES: hypothetical protein [unclassified Cupriavidus]|uniref:hypothetical protein n=1 Tax=unclassified Cupriavidus TaxID=2640874 RepID=UPI000E8D96AA|nr:MULTISPECIES: hypothetical protein [unclassified Cupriavidus]HBD36756.1 hypothetical protein [Cupriavidus sp.]HBO83136.1 hypothetical protein [Cupriavidus sp.]